MRRIRLSTWLLAAIFLAALVAYVLFKPPTDPKGAHSQQTHSTSPASGNSCPPQGAASLPG
jgi:hypothetical protein